MLISKAKFLEKKSKFYSYLYEVKTHDDIEQIVSFVRKEHKKSSHICYGALCGEELFKNDGEVGSPGKILLELLKEHVLHSHILIVARYFGGVKLGPGGVGRAFRTAGKMCVEHVPPV